MASYIRVPCFGALLFDYAKIRYRRSKMPPGSLPLPIVGNVERETVLQVRRMKQKVQQSGYHDMDWTESNRDVERRLDGK